jgi:hypothetical protein
MAIAFNFSYLLGRALHSMFNGPKLQDVTTLLATHDQMSEAWGIWDNSITASACMVARNLITTGIPTCSCFNFTALQLVEGMYFLRPKYIILVLQYFFLKKIAKLRKLYEHLCP